MSSIPGIQTGYNQYGEYVGDPNMEQVDYGMQAYQQAADESGEVLSSPTLENQSYEDPSFAALSQEEKEQQQEEWRTELIDLENEISTLRSVLAAKVQKAQDLKRKLGITVWREFQDDMNQGFKNVKESNVAHRLGQSWTDFQDAVYAAPLFQKTEYALKATAEKTTSLFGGLGQRLGQLKNSDSFRSFEDRVTSTVSNVKVKISSRSNSMQGFEEALREHEKDNNVPNNGISPTIPENKQL